jgi:MATE family multidrug resistance protein
MITKSPVEPGRRRAADRLPPGEVSAQIRLAIPLAAQQLGFQLMGTVDAALLGRYDDTALAGAGVGNSLLFAITSIGLGVVMGLDTVLPQALGARRPAQAREALRAGLRLALVVGLVCTVGAALSPGLLDLAGAPPDVARDARTYIALRALGTVPFLVSIALRAQLAAHGVTRPLVIAMVLGNVANALLDLLLIFGAGPIPGLGIAGAAIATVTVQFAIALIYHAAVRALDARDGLTPPRPAGEPRGHELAEILRHGLPIAGHMIAEVGVFSLASVLAAHMGKIPAAAHSIALNLASFTFSIAVGIGAATSVRVGHAIGAGDRPLARRRGVLGLWIGLAVMSVFAASFVIGARPLAEVFTDRAEVVIATIPLLQIAALFQLSDGAQAIAAGALRGIGKNRVTFIGNVVGHYAIGLAISLALGFGAGIGAPGLWWGLSAGLTATAIFLAQRFLAGTRTPS